MAQGSTVSDQNVTNKKRDEINPSDILKRMREFCSKFLVTENPKKEELLKNWYSYLGKLIPDLCEQLNEQFLNKESNIAHIKSQCYVFGDIHGNVQDVYDYENLFWGSNDKTSNYLFLGDYVDRGKFGVEVCVYLFALKMLAPKQFTLIRGNHEVREIQQAYTFYDECKTKFGRHLGKCVWNKINNCFERLPLVAIIDQEIFCCHGGVPKGNITIDDILKIPKPTVKIKESELADQLLWDDPIESMSTYKKDKTEKLLQSKNQDFVFNRSRLVGYYFTPLGANKFLDNNKLDYMIRAHEAEEKGYKFTSNDRVITIFSSSNYGGMSNTTACVKVTSNQIQIILIKEPSH